MMKDFNNKIKIFKIICMTIAIIVLLVGLFFSYLIAELNDAPGFVLLGSSATLAASFLIYGFGEMIVLLKKNNILLSDIRDTLKGKN